MLEREQAVLGGLAVLDAQLVGDGGRDELGAVDVAGRALAEHDEVLAHRLEPELRVERGHAHDGGDGRARALGDVLHDVHGQVAVGLLRLLQDGDEAAWHVGVGIEHWLDERQVADLAVDGLGQLVARSR